MEHREQRKRIGPDHAARDRENRNEDKRIGDHISPSHRRHGEQLPSVLDAFKLMLPAVLEANV